MPPGEQAAKLIEIAEQFKALQHGLQQLALLQQRSEEDPEISKLLKQLRDAVDAGIKWPLVEGDRAVQKKVLANRKTKGDHNAATGRRFTP